MRPEKFSMKVKRPKMTQYVSHWTSSSWPGDSSARIEK